MNQRDYLEVQIEQLGRVLKAMLGKMVGVEPDSSVQFLATLKDTFDTEIEWNPDNISELSEEGLNKLLAAAAWNQQNETMMLSYWIQSAENAEGDIRKAHAISAHRWLKAIYRKTDAISFERIELENRLQILLKENT